MLGAQEPSSETAAFFHCADLLRGTVSQTSSNVLRTLIYSNTSQNFTFLQNKRLGSAIARGRHS